MLDSAPAAATTTSVPSVPASSPAAPVSTPISTDVGNAAPAEAQFESNRLALAESLLNGDTQEQQRSRDALGRFRSTETQSDGSSPQEARPTDPIAEPSADPMQLLQSAVSQMAPEAQQALAAREQQIAAAFQEQAAVADDMRARVAPFAAALMPHEDYLASQGATDLDSAAQIAGRALQFEQQFTSDPLGAFMQYGRATNLDARQAILAIAQDAGLDILDLALGGNDVPQIDPQIQGMQSEIAAAQQAAWQAQQRAEAIERSLHDERQQLAAAQQQRQFQQAAAQVAQGISDITSKPEFASIGPEVVALFNAYARHDRTTPSRQLLERAYEAARYANPGTRQGLTANVQRDARRRDAAGINVSGAPMTTTSDLATIQREILAKHGIK